MSTLFIGGDPVSGQNSIVLTRCQILDFRRESIFHGPDYLFSKISARIRACLNPGVNSWTLSPAFTRYAAPSAILQTLGFNTTVVQRDSGPVIRVTRASGNANAPNGTLPSEAAGVNAPTTDAAIRHWLTRNRQRIVLVVGGVPLLVSPNLNADGTLAQCDVKGGPFLTANDVVYISGGKSFLIDLSVETFVNESNVFNATPSVLLSHRWSVAEDLDQDYFSTRTIRGVAHFRRDRLNFLGAAADEFRSFLVHPLPGPGWKRVDANFTPAEDDTSFSYALYDKQLAMSIIPAGVTRIESYQTVDADNGDIVAAAGGVGGAAWDLIKGALKALGGNPMGVGDLLGSLNGVAAGFKSMIPKTQVTIVARVWGRPDVGRKTLENTALAIVLNRLDRCIAQFLGFGAAIAVVSKTNMRLTHDLAGKFVECVCVRDFPVPPQGIAAAGAVVPGVGAFFPDDDETTGVLTSNHNTVTPMGLPGMANAIGVGTRGTFLMKLATATLLGPDFSPAGPIAVNNAPNNLTPP